MQSSDLVAVLNRPWKFNIFSYGPKGYLTKEDDIFMHIVKNRNGGDDNPLIFMKAEFNKGVLHSSSVEPYAANPTNTGGSNANMTKRSHKNNQQPGFFQVPDDMIQ